MSTKYRLVHLAKNLNIGLAQLVDILKKLGYQIENRPTALVPEEAFIKLQQEFNTKKSKNSEIQEISHQIKEAEPTIDIPEVESQESEKDENANFENNETEDLQDLSFFEDESDIILPEPPQYPFPRRNENGFNISWSLGEKFKFFINRILGSNKRDEFLMHNQLQGLFLGKNRLAHELTTEIVQYFKDYFEYKGTTRKRLNKKQLFKDYPEFWNKPEVNFDFKEQILIGLTDEIRVQEKKETKLKCRITKVTQYTGTNLNIYIARILSDGDKDAQIQEDIYLKVIYPWETTILVLQHDVANNLLYFESYESTFRINTEITIKYNAAWILKKLKFHILQLVLSNNIIYNGLKNNWLIQQKLNTKPSIYNGLSQTQHECVSKSIGQNLTLIWGPPGTGKSTTLASIIENLATTGSRTLICSISNVAVDGILIKYLDKIKSNKSIDPTKIVRAGNYFTETLLQEHQLIFSGSDKIKALAKEISALRLKLFDEKDEERKASLLKEILNSRLKLKELQKNRYTEAKTVFCTAAYTLFDELLQENIFDNLIIDEVSMMNLPYILWLANFSKSRIILTGDFRQLGPIASSQTRYAKLWMKRDIFQIISYDYNFDNSELVYQLTEQYRMNDQIMSQINQFYNGKLKTIEKEHQSTYSEIINKEPILCRNINNPVKRGKSGSKFNEENLTQVMLMINGINAVTLIHLPSIAIITPYREQANRYQAATENINNVKIGTIHAFQGSECDVVILDLVESKNIQDEKSLNHNDLGAIFYGMDGERLINVAISRAKSKLIIVGCKEAFLHNQVHLTTKSFRNVLKEIFENSDFR